MYKQVEEMTTYKNKSCCICTKQSHAQLKIFSKIYYFFNEKYLFPFGLTLHYSKH